ncbi:MAG: hypothetical protein OEV06_03370 [Anaerolineae bacterium]|nr:hypothetical protein [Anaerolineae bacterium]
MSTKLDSDLLEAIEAEFQSGSTAQKEGNLGKARVCARRALGIALKGYYTGMGVEFSSSSAFDTIRYMLDDDSAPDDVKERLSAFTQKLAKDSHDQDSYWPLAVDLLDEARWIISRLMS